MPMTSEEIKAALEDTKSEKGWIKEVAYQLAVLNETMAAGEPEPDEAEAPEVRQKRKYVRKAPQ